MPAGTDRRFHEWDQPMFNVAKGRLTAVLMVSALGLTGCVSKSKFDDLQAQYGQLQQQNASLTQQLDSANAAVARLQGAIKYTVNSDLLFASGSWTMSDRGKQIIAGFAKKLAPTMQHHLLVAGYTDNVPISPALAAQGVTSNEILSQKRAEAVRDFIVSQGANADLVEAKGFGEKDPVASNKTAAGRAKNRRVELSIMN
ncbi:OmpA family protein [Rhodopila sp.]|uniref:OmpA family protein n=1 Tax=Rhodopila sp. TaxID=2480087 RepID=UPI002C7A06B3|nr:OmpA family protein [Rhodopila sp.]HVZ10233.1 OmpA family protein [Rhodopila sp.]